LDRWVKALLVVLAGLLQLAYTGDAAQFSSMTDGFAAAGDTVLALVDQEQELAAHVVADADVAADAVAEIAEPIDEELVAVGRDVYRRNYCGTCHTLAAAETTGVFGPAHDHVASLALERLADPQYQGNATTAEAYIRESILEPQVYIAPGSMIAHQQMPPFTHLPAEDIDAMVYFLAQQK
jgi:nitric oxide reductase subunit C